MTDHDNASRTLHLFFREKASSQDWFNPEDFEIVCGNETPGQALCDAIASMDETKRDPTVVVRREGNRFEDAILPAPVDEVGRRSVMIVVVVLRVRFPHVHNPL